MTTPGPDVYQTAAQALSEHSRLTVARVTVDDPGFRAVDDVAFRAGRKAAAKAIENADTSGWPGGRGSDVDGCQERAAEIARGVQ